MGEASRSTTEGNKISPVKLGTSTLAGLGNPDHFSKPGSNIPDILDDYSQNYFATIRRLGHDCNYNHYAAQPPSAILPSFCGTGTGVIN
jgi:hypothetical protein